MFEAKGDGSTSLAQLTFCLQGKSIQAVSVIPRRTAAILKSKAPVAAFSKPAKIKIKNYQMNQHYMEQILQQLGVYCINCLFKLLT